MAKKNPKVDAYITEAAPFAQPILRRLRKLVHAGCPAVEETIKWGFPHFVYKGNIAGMAAFKQHCVFGFWKDALLFNRENGEQKEAMGQFGRLTDVAELPEDKVLIGYVRRAAELNETGVEVERERKTRPVPELPDDFRSALEKNTKAKTTFDNFSPSKRRAYIEWITEAKRPQTRNQRLATSIEWLAQGKAHSWRYEG
ncbi:MAG: YdeI/OmpD-associated family protein [Chthoniobacterales bacterium]